MEYRHGPQITSHTLRMSSRPLTPQRHRTARSRAPGDSTSTIVATGGLRCRPRNAQEVDNDQDGCDQSCPHESLHRKPTSSTDMNDGILGPPAIGNSSFVVRVKPVCTIHIKAVDRTAWRQIYLDTPIVFERFRHVVDSWIPPIERSKKRYAIRSWCKRAGEAKGHGNYLCDHGPPRFPGYCDASCEAICRNLSHYRVTKSRGKTGQHRRRIHHRDGKKAYRECCFTDAKDRLSG
jgi:hypothetical protein